MRTVHKNYEKLSRTVLHKQRVNSENCGIVLNRDLNGSMNMGTLGYRAAHGRSRPDYLTKQAPNIQGQNQQVEN